MTDREMLEFAAKAAGIKIVAWYGDVADGGPWAEHEPRQAENVGWNPRTDDGDCARMEAAIGIHVTWHSDGVVCGKRIWQETAMFEDHNGDKQAARRIASLRIAAEVGKAML